MSSAGGRVAREEAGWRYSAKDCEAWPGLRLCLQVIPRIFHGCALFLAVQRTKEGQSNLHLLLTRRGKIRMYTVGIVF